MKRLTLLLFICALLPVTASAQQLIPYRKGELWGYADATLKIRVRPEYDAVGRWGRGGLAWVRRGDRYGYVNSTGRLVIPLKYEGAGDFNGSGTAWVRLDGSSFCLDTSGNRVPCRDECGGTRGVMHYMASYRNGDKYGLITPLTQRNEDGKRRYHRDTLPAVWDTLITVGGSYYAVARRGDCYGIIDTIGVAVTPDCYESIEAGPDYAHGEWLDFLVLEEGRYGLLDYQGKPLIESKYYRMEHFDGALARAWLDENFWGYVDRAGREYFER